MSSTHANNPTLQAWLDEYRAIADEYVEAVRETGVTFGEPYAWKACTDGLLGRLREKGALFRNGCASVVSGPISEACVACSSSLDDRTLYFSLKCHRSCYFCFNPNQEGYEQGLREYADWRGDLAGLAAEGRSMTHLALTGGEPLLDPEETLAFFSEARNLWPEAHLRLYTTGDQLDEGLLARLAEAGMNEIRFSVKPDDSAAARERAMGNLRMACAFAAGRPDLDVMVEMPVIPGTFDEMAGLLDELEGMGAFGINLLEFCYPFNNWHEFSSRGFQIKNPPFPVMYDYEYAGSLPVEGSEEECLALVEYALDAGLKLGVHYCSLENKHRSQVQQQNRSARLGDPCYRMDPDDFFYKAAKVFGPDAAPVRAFLEASVTGPALTLGGRSWAYDAEDDCLRFHPRHLPAVLAADLRTAEGRPITPVMSVSILEWHGREVVLRELDLQPILHDEA